MTYHVRDTYILRYVLQFSSDGITWSNHTYFKDKEEAIKCRDHFSLNGLKYRVVDRETMSIVAFGTCRIISSKPLDWKECGF